MSRALPRWNIGYENTLIDPLLPKMVILTKVLILGFFEIFPRTLVSPPLLLILILKKTRNYSLLSISSASQDRHERPLLN